MISTVISFSTLETRFFPALIKEAKKFSGDIIVVAYDHFFDGSEENIEILSDLHIKYPELNWFICKWDGDHDSKYWHNNARWTGAEQAKHRCVLFLDADEIPDGDLMKQFIKTESLENYVLFMFSCYWYFRDPTNQATTKEGCGLLADMSQLSKEMFFTRYERWIFNPYPTIPTKFYCTLNDQTMFHHYSWVRTKEEMLTKVKSWAHSGDRNWTQLVENEFEHEFIGKDFVHGYSYNKVPNTFDIGN